MPLEEYHRKRDFAKTPEPAGAEPRRGRAGAELRRAEARGARAALRLPARARRRAAVVGGAEGAVARHPRQAARGARRGPPARVRRLRGHHPGRRVRRRHRDRVGPRHVGAGGRPACGAREGRPEVRPARREAPRALGAGAHAAAARREAGELAADQGEGRVGPTCRGVRRDRGGAGLARSRAGRSRRSGWPGRSAGTGSRRRPRRPQLAACEHPRRPPRPACPQRSRRTSTGSPVRRTARAEPLAGSPLPIDVELATLVDSPPQGEGWLAEAKYDGYRLVLVLDGGRARAFTRNHADWSDRFAPLVRAVEGLPAASAVIDGEAVVFDAEGVSRFELLQRGARARIPSASRTRRSTCCSSTATTCATCRSRSARSSCEPCSPMRARPRRCATPITSTAARASSTRTPARPGSRASCASARTAATSPDADATGRR